LLHIQESEYPPTKASKLSARKNLSASITILFDSLRNRLRSMDVKVLTDKYMEPECSSWFWKSAQNQVNLG